MFYHGQLSYRILGAAIEVHRTLGPGLLESAYEEALAYEFSLRRLPFVRQVPLPFRYKGVLLRCGFRLDFVVENAVIVELKCTDVQLPVHEAQLLTYLKLSRLRVGLLINFNVQFLHEGVVRMVL